MAKQKFYVVWKGVNPGIYSSWTDCQLQIQGYKGAIYKSFDSQEEAEHAFATPAYQYMNRHRASNSEKAEAQLPENFNLKCLAVDAACSGNPGPMEYRGVYLLTGQEIFHSLLHMLPGWLPRPRSKFFCCISLLHRDLFLR